MCGGMLPAGARAVRGAGGWGSVSRACEGLELCVDSRIRCSDIRPIGHDSGIGGVPRRPLQDENGCRMKRLLHETFPEQVAANKFLLSVGKNKVTALGEV